MLIQTVRANHALSEIRPISIPAKAEPIYQYLNKFFNINYTIGKEENIIIDHRTPRVVYKEKTYPLLFPRAIFNKCKKLRSQEKRHEFFFQGYIKEHREKLFEPWRDKATIIPTETGRKSLTRYWDVDYLTNLSQTWFALCPSGACPWSYRFFEAILCGAVPVVNKVPDCYKGFYFHLWGDTAFRYQNIEENFNLAKKRLTL